MTAVLLLLLPVCGLAALVWLSALLEWHRPSDAKALAIDQSFSRNDAHFPDRFRALAADWWQDPAKARHLEETGVPAGSQFRETTLSDNLESGPDCRFDSELWIRHRGHLGDRTRARAVLCEGALVVGRDCHIERWVHAEDCLTVDEGCHLGARVTSGRVISLGPGCRANLISAAEIHWTSQAEDLRIPPSLEYQRWENFEARITSETADGTVFVDGDVIVEETAHIDFPLVVRGSLYVHHGALLAGDIKTHGDLVVEHSEILGNLTSLGRLVLGDGAVVQGCLRGDKGVWLGDRILLGRPHRLVAVVGEHIHLSGSGTLFGRLKALNGWVEVDR